MGILWNSGRPSTNNPSHRGVSKPQLLKPWNESQSHLTFELRFILAEWQLWVHPNIIQITPSYIVPVDSAIMFFACIYVFFLALDAVHHRNNMLLLAICVSNGCAFAFSVMLYRNMKQIVNNMPSQRDGMNQPLVDQDRNIWYLISGFQLACPIMIGLCTLATWASSFHLQKQYAWDIYRSVQGDSETKSRYLNYEVSGLHSLLVICSD